MDTYRIKRRIASINLIPQPNPVPFYQDANGVSRVTAMRVLLDLIVHAFDDEPLRKRMRDGTTPGRWGDVYAVIGYYRTQRSEVESEVQARATQGQEIWENIAKSQSASPTSKLAGKIRHRLR